jgi:hypothetical protein
MSVAAPYLKVRRVAPAADKRAARSTGTYPPATAACAAACTAACVRIGTASMLEAGPAVPTLGLPLCCEHAAAAGCSCSAFAFAASDAAAAAPPWPLLSSSANTPVAHDAPVLAHSCAVAEEAFAATADVAAAAAGDAAAAADEPAASGTVCACGCAGTAAAQLHPGGVHSTAMAASSTAASAASDMPKLCHL